jgi:recombination protein RecA
MPKKESKEGVENTATVFDLKDTNQKKLAWDAALLSAEKKHGKGAVSKITDEVLKDEELLEQVISTGILQVDRATKRGGFVKGRIVEIYGPEQSGKTTLCLHTSAEVLKAGGSVLYIDMEHALEKQHVNNIGIKELNVSQPDSGEEALDMAEIFAKAGTDLIVVDSVSALVPQAEIDGNMGDLHVGLQARLMSQAMRKLTGVVAKSGTVLIFINQIRYKIGVMFGSPETTSGGNALKFYASVRIDMRRKDSLKLNEEIVANLVKAKVVKNKSGQPYGEEEFYLFFKANKTKAANAIEFASELGIVTRTGSWYSYNEQKLGQGLANAVEFLVNTRPELIDEITALCRKDIFKKKLTLDSIL